MNLDFFMTCFSNEQQREYSFVYEYFEKQLILGK